MAPRKINDETLVLRLPTGTVARLDAAKAEGETRTDILRRAIERELKRLERKKGGDQ